MRCHPSPSSARRSGPPLFLVVLAAFGLGAFGQHAEPLPQPVDAMIAAHCLDCHDSETEKGGINLDHAAINWADPKQRHLWERVLEVSEQGLMPPAKKPQPDARARDKLHAWLDQRLLQHTPIGGTPPRRLSRDEYRETIKDLFDRKDFRLPDGFPGDTEFHGFRNMGEGLRLSGPLLEAYAEVAWQIADSLYPPAKAAPVSSTRLAKPEDLVLSFSAASVRKGKTPAEDALRLASRSPDIMRSCTWPSRMEITDSGIYKVSIRTSTFRPNGADPMLLEVRARSVTAPERSKISAFRLLKTFEVKAESPATLAFEAELYEGETVLFRWANAELTHTPAELHKLMQAKFAAEPRFLAAWQKTVFPKGLVANPNTTRLRGRNGWNILNRHWQDPDLDLSQASLDSKISRRLLGMFNTQGHGTFSFADALCHYYFEHGPSLEIHQVAIDGPLRRVDGPREKQMAAQRKRVAGIERGALEPAAYAESMLRHFLPKAFRRPVDDETVQHYLGIATTHWEDGHSFEEGMHLLLRNILMSPRFLYRALEKDAQLDDYDLATRLSYFLVGRPPDATLKDLARRSRLSPGWVLRRETQRLLPTRHSHPFVERFTEQWLDTDRLPEIMPDPVFRFAEADVDTATAEVEQFFTAMIRENRPLTDFIDPDFTYTSARFAKKIYELDTEAVRRIERAAKKGPRANLQKSLDRVQRIKLERGGRVGGLLGQSAVMMTTANGVDTQPVLRGVWVLENILGSPPPEPPEDVPALTPDTRGATTPRELLAAHTEEASCAGCHRRIDPVGFVLENMDPVGRWRDTWPKSNKRIDAAVVLPDGTEVVDLVAFKAWLVEHIDTFAVCLSEKLLTHATGRVLNYAERNEIESIVDKHLASEAGFRDLLLDLVDSKTFRAK